jgi:hypothetical protein
LSTFIAPTIFIANAVRQSAISDNSPIYSNIKERVWVSPQASGGDLADADNGNFGSSAAGAKTGFSFINGRNFSAGIFAGFAHRAYAQGESKATATDMDFGLYGGFGLGGKLSLSGFAGYGLQSVKVEGGGASSEFDATVVKFGARAEISAGLISPFLGFEGAIVNADEINLKSEIEGESVKMDAASYSRMSSQLGIKIGGENWHIKPYVDFLFAGNKPEYSAKPHYENDEAKTKAAKSQTIEGTDESPASFGLGIGATLPVSGSVDIFANADAKMNADYFGYQANVGAAFKF